MSLAVTGGLVVDGLVAALDEAVDAARAGGARLEVSHLKAVGKPNHGLVYAALERLDQARADGVDVTWDAYPYTATSVVTPWYSWVGASGDDRRLKSACE